MFSLSPVCRAGCLTLPHTLRAAFRRIFLTNSHVILSMFSFILASPSYPLGLLLLSFHGSSRQCSSAVSLSLAPSSNPISRFLFGIVSLSSLHSARARVSHHNVNPAVRLHSDSVTSALSVQLLFLLSFPFFAGMCCWQSPNSQSRSKS